MDLTRSLFNPIPFISIGTLFLFVQLYFFSNFSVSGYEKPFPEIALVLLREAQGGRYAQGYKIKGRNSALQRKQNQQ